jgi:hypothetical protein
VYLTIFGQNGPKKIEVLHARQFMEVKNWKIAQFSLKPLTFPKTAHLSRSPFFSIKFDNRSPFPIPPSRFIRMSSSTPRCHSEARCPGITWSSTTTPLLGSSTTTPRLRGCLCHPLGLHHRNVQPRLRGWLRHAPRVAVPGCRRPGH